VSHYRFIMFDLDGTLTDPGEGIINSTLFALARFGIQEDPLKLKRFIGPPLIDSFMRYYGFNEEKARKAVEFYRVYYREKGIFENHLYPGISGLLKTLTERGKILVLATSKPTVFARQILEHFEIARYFEEELVVGSYLDGRRAVKAEVIRTALLLLGGDGENTVMVGDRKFDILGAKANAIDSIGVTFGYGEQDEIELAGPTQMAHSVEELGELLVGNRPNIFSKWMGVRR